jgi:hypothetical protein
LSEKTISYVHFRRIGLYTLLHSAAPFSVGAVFAANRSNDHAEENDEPASGAPLED